MARPKVHQSPDYRAGYAAGYEKGYRAGGGRDGFKGGKVRLCGRAYWIIRKCDWYCSNCGTKHDQAHSDFCCKCGFQMSEEAIV